MEFADEVVANVCHKCTYIHTIPVPRFRLNTYGRRTFSGAAPMTHSRILSGIQRAAQTVLGVYLNRTYSRDTSAIAHWMFLTLMHYTNPRTHSPTQRSLLRPVLCDTLCTSGFLDNIMFVHSGPYGATGKSVKIWENHGRELLPPFSWMYMHEDNGRPPSWIFKIEIFDSLALPRHGLRHPAKFCGDRSYRSRDVAIFRTFFLVKCKSSLDDLSEHGITLPKLHVEIME